MPLLLRRLSRESRPYSTLRLRPSGGFYWLPEDKLALWQEVSAAVEKSAFRRPHACYVLRVAMDADAVRAVRDAIVAEVTAEANRIRAEVLSGKLKEREFLTRTARNDYRWNRPNRRFVTRRLYLPSLAGESLGEVVVAVDTSGSIGQEELDRFTAEVQGIVEAYDVHLSVLFHDTAVSEVREWSPQDGPIKLRPIGGGGTSHRCVFKWVEEHGVDPSCVVILTDLYTTFPSGNPPYPVLWAVVGGCNMEPPFGSRISVG